MGLSSRSRWRACASSVALSAGIEDVPSPYAAEGSCGHEVGEFYVRQHFGVPYPSSNEPIPADATPPVQTPPEGLDLGGKTPEEWNEELCNHGRGYRDFIISLIPADESASLVIERHVAAPTIHEDVWGTLDLAIWLGNARKLLVVDFKYGFNPVDIGTPDDPNPQCAGYAVCVCETFGLQPDSVALVVYQPRLSLRDKSPSLDLPGSWLAEERIKLAQEARAVDAATEMLAGGPAGPGDVTPGDHCRYCRAGKAGRCPAVVETAATAADVACGERKVLALADEDCIRLWAARTAFKGFWEDVEERVERLAKDGNPGLTIKTRQGRQMWKDKREATQTLLAMGRLDLLQPAALSDALDAIPEAFRADMVTRGNPSKIIEAVGNPALSSLGNMFRRYAGGVDVSA